VNKIYASPFRVYLVLGALAICGLFAGYKLPVSLFPNSSKPVIGVHIPYGNQTAEEFLNNYGNSLEYSLRNITDENITVEQVKATYRRRGGASYDVIFKWGTPSQAALNETTNTVNAFAARLPRESREGTNTWMNSQNSGFFAVGFYSQIRDLDELYDILDPVLTPKLTQVKDAQSPTIWNPSQKEVRVELIPEKLAALRLLPKDIESAITSTLSGYSGGSLSLGNRSFQIEMPRQTFTVEDLGNISVRTPGGTTVHLSDIAFIDFGPQSNASQAFKTSGAPSLILYASPKPGGNIKKMSDEMLTIVKEAMLSLPKDIEYKIIVDPSEFIQAAVDNVVYEVALAALIATLVLFVFYRKLSKCDDRGH